MLNHDRVIFENGKNRGDGDLAVTPRRQSGPLATRTVITGPREIPA